MDKIMKDPAWFTITGTNFSGKTVTKNAATKVADMNLVSKIESVEKKPKDISEFKDSSVDLADIFKLTGYIESIGYMSGTSNPKSSKDIAVFKPKITKLPKKWDSFPKQVQGFTTKGNFLVTWDAEVVEYWTLEQDKVTKIEGSDIPKVGKSVAAVSFMTNLADSKKLDLYLTLVDDKNVAEFHTVSFVENKWTHYQCEDEIALDQGQFIQLFSLGSD
jgi:hypothetical protein